MSSAANASSPKQSQNGFTESTCVEPVAIIGMGCRWPGGCSQPSELWDLLSSEKDAYSEFPADRINTDGFYHEKKGRPGSFYTRGGCFLDSDVRAFDHTFFGINPQEAITMDPAQRRLLEVVYEAFESAGVTLDQLSGSPTGCFVGNFNYDHQLMQYRDTEYPEPYCVTGGGITILSNRINYVFNLKGPSMTIDTACSSSMYALHLACSAIQNGDCLGAIVAGSNLILTPECQLFSSVLGAVSPTSRCHTFDAAADGYARADGVGALYVKGLANALRDGDPIRAVIRGVAVNANGKTSGISHPSSAGQEDAIRQAYKRAGNLDYSETGYIECHGTGTAVGDPLEVLAITNVFAHGRSRSNPLLLGSIKSNIGHSEAASGIAGVMKAVLSLEHGVIPATVGFQKLNPNIGLKDGSFQIVSKSVTWPSLPVRRASVNSFGYGGANAHVILESMGSFLQDYRYTMDTLGRICIPSGYHQRESTLNSSDASAIDTPVDSLVSNVDNLTANVEYLLVFSAHNERTLKKNIDAFAGVVKRHRVMDIAHTLAVRRTAFVDRCFVVVNHETIDTELCHDRMPIYKKRSQVPRIGFVFTGQGAQWARMGLDLMDSNLVYLKTIRYLDRVIAELGEHSNWSIEETIRKATSDEIGQSEVSQPTTTALQIALVEVLKSWNVRPSASLGHSSGEIAAAYSAGLISMEEAMVIAFYRGKVTSKGKKDGLMLAVGIGERSFRAISDNLSDHVAIACYNSPESITLSGTNTVVSQVKALLDQKKIFTKILATGENAYHSSHMGPLGAPYEMSVTEGLKTLSRKRSLLPDTPFFSTVTGSVLDKQSLGVRYWRSNLESPVLFHQALEDLITTAPVDILLEIGPHHALKSPIQQTERSHSRTSFPEYLSTLSRGNNGLQSILSTAGNLWARGYPVDLDRVNSSSDLESPESETPNVQTKNVIVDLPRFQWQYDTSPLLENRWTREWRLRKHARHDILGSRILGGAPTAPTWRNVLRARDLPWLQDHRLGSQIVFPAAGYLLMAMEAVTQTFELQDHGSLAIKSFVLQDVALESALVIPTDDSGTEILLSLYPAKPNLHWIASPSWTFLISSVHNALERENAIEHARGQIIILYEDTVLSKQHFEKWRSQRPNRSILPSQWYQAFTRVGLNYGPSFQGLSSIRCPASRDTSIAEAEVRLVPDATARPFESRYVLHPAALDALLQLSIIASQSGVAARLKTSFLPVSIRRLAVHATLCQDSPSPARSFSTSRFCGIRDLVSDISLASSSSQPLLEITDLRLVGSDQLSSIVSREDDHPYVRLLWKPDFDFLSTASIGELYPPIPLDETAVTPALNELALHQIAQFYLSHQHLFKTLEVQPHIQKFLNWVIRKVDIAIQGGYPKGKEILDYSFAKREEEIQRLSSTIYNLSSESRTMCRIYRNLPAIVKGEKSGLQVALQDGLLVEMYESGQVINEGNRRLASVVDLLAHKSASLRILEIGAGTGSATRQILPMLKGDSLDRRYNTYAFTDVTTSFLKPAEDRLQAYKGVTYSTFDMEKPAIDQGFAPHYDLVVASNVLHASSDIVMALRNVRSVMQEGGKLVLLEVTQTPLFSGLILGTFSDFWNGHQDPSFPRLDGPFLSKEMWAKALGETGFGDLDFILDDYAGQPCSTVLTATAVDPSSSLPASVTPTVDGISIIFRTLPTKFVLDFSKYLVSQNIEVHLQCLDSEEVPKYNRLIYLTEITAPLFIDLTSAEWQGLQALTKEMSGGLWVTNGGVLSGRSPIYSIASGLLRGIKAERNELRLAVLDLHDDLDIAGHDIFETITKVLDRVSNDAGPAYDFEFRRQKGVIFRSSLYLDDRRNEENSARTDQSKSAEFLRLDQLRDIPLQLEIEKPSVLSTLSFKEDRDYKLALEDNCVELDVMAIGLNNKDLAVLTGSHHSDTFSSECAGRIRQVGKGVVDFKPGDRVFCPSFARFGTRARVLASFCQRMEHEDSFEEMATMPLAFSTAIYGLMTLGRLSKGETVLIQSATGGLGYAAIQIARHCGAHIFATVGTETKKQELLGRNFGIPADRIYYSREKMTPQLILDDTNCKGIDVILSTSRGESIHDYWRCIAPFGRFVEVGRTEVLNNGHLDMGGFLRNASFTSFDLEIISKEKPEIIADSMVTLKRLHQQRIISPIPHELFHVSQIETALIRFTEEARTGKVVVNYEENEGLIKYNKSPFRSRFDPSASYLLVGCLGGLGQIFSEWMVDRGARSLVYLSRSGNDKKEVQDFLSKLSNRGVDIKVIRGDVTSAQDVERAVLSIKRPLKGVIQAALTLHDIALEKMTLEAFHATLKPRVMGTRNLHNTTQSSPLDFFVMWSSWTALVGTATQANYLASCTFMDAFARHRRSLGLPATSLSLNAINGLGSLSHRTEYGLSLARNGLYGNTEEDFLHYCDAAIANSNTNIASDWTGDPLSNAHLLAGVGPQGLQKLDQTWPIKDMGWYHDRRFSGIVQAIGILNSTDATSVLHGADKDQGDVVQRIHRKIAQLLYTSADNIDIIRPINDYGIDSMIAAELRNWLYASFATDVPLLSMLSPTMTIEDLGRQVIVAE